MNDEPWWMLNHVEFTQCHLHHPQVTIFSLGQLSLLFAAFWS
jgi:hypothetical protein